MNFNGFWKRNGALLLFITIIYIVFIIGVCIAIAKAPIGTAFNILVTILWVVSGWLLWRNGWSKFKN